MGGRFAFAKPIKEELRSILFVQRFGFCVAIAVVCLESPLADLVPFGAEKRYAACEEDDRTQNLMFDMHFCNILSFFHSTFELFFLNFFPSQSSERKLPPKRLGFLTVKVTTTKLFFFSLSCLFFEFTYFSTPSARYHDTPPVRTRFACEMD
jgi:hypothetical protein